MRGHSASSDMLDFLRHYASRHKENDLSGGLKQDIDTPIIRADFMTSPPSPPPIFPLAKDNNNDGFFQNTKTKQDTFSIDNYPSSRKDYIYFLQKRVDRLEKQKKKALLILANYISAKGYHHVWFYKNFR